MGGRRRGFVSRRRFPHGKSRISHVNILQTVGAAGSSLEFLIRTPATIDEDPDHTVISDGTAGAEVAEKSKIIKVDCYLEIASDQAADPGVVTFMVWKDDSHGALAAPTTATDVAAPSTTLQLQALKKNICQYERFLMSANNDKRRFYIRIPRRHRYLRQGESIQMTIFNGMGDAITTMVFGRIWTIGG